MTAPSPSTNSPADPCPDNSSTAATVVYGFNNDSTQSTLASSHRNGTTHLALPRDSTSVPRNTTTDNDDDVGGDATTANNATTNNAPSNSNPLRRSSLISPPLDGAGASSLSVAVADTNANGNNNGGALEQLQQGFITPVHFTGNPVTTNANIPDGTQLFAPVAQHPDSQNIQSYEYCCISQTNEPPIDAVTFDIPGTGNPSPQVFERTALYRYIANPGTGRAYSNVKYPITGKWIGRDVALNYVNSVPNETQQRFNTIRQRLGLSLSNEDPITDADRASMRRIAQRFDQFLIFSCICHVLFQLLSLSLWYFVIHSVDDSDSSDDDILQPVGISNGNRNVRARVQPRSQSGRSSQPTARSENNVNEVRRRVQLGGFINSQGTSIRSSSHATALNGIMNIAQAHPDGVLRALGHSNRVRWFEENTSRLFQEDGPLSAFAPVTPQVLQRHFRGAMQLARTTFDRDHSNDPTGDEHEDIPGWMRPFFRLFEAQQADDTRNPSAAQVRTQRRQVAASIIGRQAPLGVRDNSRPAVLRDETTGSGSNGGASNLRQQIIGGVNSERVGNNAGGEGQDDQSNVRRAPRFQSGTRRRNVHTSSSFDPDDNDPAARFSHIRRGYESLHSISEAIANRFTASSTTAPQRTPAVIAREYNEIAQFLSQTADDTPQYRFYQNAFSVLNAELDQIHS